MHKVLPIINQEGSDSAMLDNALEFMVMSGMDPVSYTHLDGNTGYFHQGRI